MNQNAKMSNSSVTSRLSAVSLAIVAAGAALSSVGQTNVLFSIKNSGAIGLRPAAPGIVAYNQPILFALYIALICGAITIFLGVRSSLKNTPTPPAWLLVIGTTIGLSPVLGLWMAESALIKLYPAPRYVLPSAYIDLPFMHFFMVFGGSLVIATLLLVGAVLRIRSSAKQKWSVGAAAVLLETALVVATTAFHLRNDWLHHLWDR